MVPAMRDRSVPAMRTLRRSPPWLALFALALQFIAAFGHLHPEDYRFLAVGHSPISVTHGGPSVPSAPAMPADSDCPICASILLLGNAPVPILAAIPAPLATIIAALRFGETLLLALPPHFLFATRGPPLA